MVQPRKISGIFSDVSLPEDEPKNTLHVKVGEHAIVVITDTIKNEGEGIDGGVKVEVYCLDMNGVVDDAYADCMELEKGGANYSDIEHLTESYELPKVNLTPLTKEEEVGVRKALDRTNALEAHRRRQGQPFSKDSLADFPGMTYGMEHLTRVAHMTAKLVGHEIVWGTITRSNDPPFYENYKREGKCSRCGRVVILLSKPTSEQAAIDGTAITENCEEPTHAEDVIPAE
jgi:hypothetical protein